VLENIKRQREEEEARQKMRQFYINKYQPPSDYYNKFSNADFFEDQYMDYIKRINHDIDTTSESPHSGASPLDVPKAGKNMSMMSTETEDRDDGISQAESDYSSKG